MNFIVENLNNSKIDKLRKNIREDLHNIINGDIFIYSE